MSMRGRDLGAQESRPGAEALRSTAQDGVGRLEELKILGLEKSGPGGGPVGEGRG